MSKAPTAIDAHPPVLTVTEIESGRDGYTAQLKDNKNEKYIMVVSIPNLGEGYVDLKIGDNVRVTGEYAESYPVQIFATAIELLTSAENDFIKGRVIAIENGTDGYTAKIKTEDGEVYFATISIPNLGRENANQYRTLSIGEMVSMKGEMWSMGDEKRITVRALLPR